MQVVKSLDARFDGLSSKGNDFLNWLRTRFLAILENYE
jgi:hypothetical protein